MTDNELLPCPFCGGEALLLGDYAHGYAVECHDCSARTASYGSENEAAAIVAWNARAERGSRTCHIEVFDDGVDEALDGEWFSYAPPTWYLSCGHEAQGLDRPNYCPNCGARVEVES